MRIDVAKLISKDIGSRDSIKIIDKKARSDKEGAVVLDFSGVRFISRSFADELIMYLDSHDPHYQLQNATGDAEKMIEVVRKSRKTPRKKIEFDRIEISDLEKLA